MGRITSLLCLSLNLSDDGGRFLHLNPLQGASNGNKEKEGIISEGVLFCSKCSRFYPIIEEIPILLPDELRDKKQEIEFLKTYKDKLPEKIITKANPWHL